MPTQREKPIIFSSQMVQAILDGRKTQTRRVIIPQEFVEMDDDGELIYVHSPKCPNFCDYACGGRLGYSKYGKPGDRLWVREAIHRHIPLGATYTADLTAVMGSGPTGSSLYGRAQIPWLWKRDYLTARFMPRWASRITLEITKVRVERVNDISEDDAFAEGIDAPRTGKSPIGEPAEAIYEYMRLWDVLNFNRGYSWQSNPFVWVLEFKRCN